MKDLEYVAEMKMKNGVSAKKEKDMMAEQFVSTLGNFLNAFDDERWEQIEKIEQERQQKEKEMFGNLDEDAPDIPGTKAHYYVKWLLSELQKYQITNENAHEWYNEYGDYILGHFQDILLLKDSYFLRKIRTIKCDIKDSFLTFVPTEQCSFDYMFETIQNRCKDILKFKAYDDEFWHEFVILHNQIMDICILMLS